MPPIGVPDLLVGGAVAAVTAFLMVADPVVLAVLRPAQGGHRVLSEDRDLGDAAGVLEGFDQIAGHRRFFP